MKLVLLVFIFWRKLEKFITAGRKDTSRILNETSFKRKYSQLKSHISYGQEIRSADAKFVKKVFNLICLRLLEQSFPSFFIFLSQNWDYQRLLLIAVEFSFS